jgi:hypothetical protein
MSDVATPDRAPTETVDDVVNRLIAEQDAADAVDNGAPADPAQSAAPVAESPQPGEQSQDQEPEPQPEEPPRYRVKVRGQEIEVPLPELLNGYSRNEDYKAKTAEVAEQRRALEARQAEFTARAQKLDQLMQQAPYDPVLVEGQKTDWQKLAQEDPATYVQKKAAFEARVSTWQQLHAEQQAAAMQAHEQRRQQSDALLAAELPEWRDTAKRGAFAKQLAETLGSYGFSQEEIGGLTDHRVVKVMADLLKAKAAQSARASAETKRTTSPPARVLQPGAARDSRAPNASAQALANRARQTARTSDQVAAALAILES